MSNESTENEARIGGSGLNAGLGKDISKMRDASYLLPPPGGEVARELLDEVERLRFALTAISNRHVICGSRGDFRDGQLSALETCRKVANDALGN